MKQRAAKGMEINEQWDGSALARKAPARKAPAPKAPARKAPRPPPGLPLEDGSLVRSYCVPSRSTLYQNKE